MLSNPNPHSAGESPERKLLAILRPDGAQERSRSVSEMAAECQRKMAVAAETQIERQRRQTLPVLQQTQRGFFDLDGIACTCRLE